MSEPLPDPAWTAAAPTPATGEGPGNAIPYLLVLPTSDAAPATVAWPGPEGKPGWAIPVSIPAGTRGYAVFIPLVSATAASAEADTRPVPAPVPATPAGEKTPPAADTPEARTAAEPPAEQPPAEQPAAGERQVDESAAGPPAGQPPAEQPPPVPPQPAVPQPAAPQPAIALPPPAMPQPAIVPPAMPTAGAAPIAVPTAPFGRYAPTPARPSFFETRWPGPTVTRGAAVPAAVLAGALGAAVFVPLGRTGIGWFLGWLTLTVGVVVAVRQPATDLPRAERWIRAGWAAAALALTSVLTFRNAWWLVTFCVLGALGCAALAIVDGRQVRSILFSLVAAPLAAIRGLPWVRRHLAAPAHPAAIWRIAWSVAITVLVLVLFGSLLSSADAAFSLLLGELVPEIDGGKLTSWVFLLAMGGLIAVAAVYTISAPPDLSTIDKPGTHTLRAVEWGLPIGGLTVLFAGFVTVQFTVLFGGQRHVLRTAGLSYADYARSGFWQLFMVTVLTLAVLGGVTRWARHERPVERILLRVLLGLLCALSIVIVVSALSRMYAYQQVYSFTGERIFVMAFELLLGTLFVMIMMAGIRWRGAWIPRLAVGLAVVMLLSLAVLNPEGYAAGRNLARYQQTGEIDAWYLRALSADATPTLATLPDPVRRCAVSWIADELDQPDPWYAWNLGRARARQALDRLGPDAAGGQGDCLTAGRFDLPKGR